MWQCGRLTGVPEEDFRGRKLGIHRGMCRSFRDGGWKESWKPIQREETPGGVRDSSCSVVGRKTEGSNMKDLECMKPWMKARVRGLGLMTLTLHKAVFDSRLVWRWWAKHFPSSSSWENGSRSEGGYWLARCAPGSALKSHVGLSCLCVHPLGRIIHCSISSSFI